MKMQYLVLDDNVLATLRETITTRAEEGWRLMGPVTTYVWDTGRCQVWWTATMEREALP
jgi:hypothetical protein